MDAVRESAGALARAAAGAGHKEDQQAMSPRDDFSAQGRGLPIPSTSTSRFSSRVLGSFFSACRLGRKDSGRLRLESLEERLLPTASPLDEVVGAGWFQDVAGTSQPLHAGAAAWSAASTDQHATSSQASSQTFDWIVQFQTSALTGITSAAQTASFLAGSGVEFEVLRGLGLVGEVLVRSQGANAQTVERVLASNRSIASFEAPPIQIVEEPAVS